MDEMRQKITQQSSSGAVIMAMDVISAKVNKLEEENTLLKKQLDSAERQIIEEKIEVTKLMQELKITQRALIASGIAITILTILPVFIYG